MVTTMLIPLYSPLAADPDLAELVEAFVHELPYKLELLVRHFRCGELERLGRHVHQLKGAAGSYGFPEVTTAAAQLELSIREESPASQIEEQLEDLIETAQRCRAGCR